MVEKTYPELSWDQAVDEVSKATFNLLAGDRVGTCFLVSLGAREADKTYAFALVTAWHVVSELIEDAENISLVPANKKDPLLLNREDCAIYRCGPDYFDTALIIGKESKPIFSIKDLLPLFPLESMLARGAEVGWLGFPGFVGPELCFFRGVISGYVIDPPAYLVDGVAIKGVSGGPVFNNRAHIIGFVSSYIPSRVDSATTLPGLMTVIPINLIRYIMENIMGALVI